MTNSTFRKTRILFLSITFLSFSIKSENNIVDFIVNAVKNIDQVGAIAPMSSYTGKDLVKSVAQHSGHKRILEIGAGVGNVTEEIVGHLNPGDILDVIEIDPEFCKILREKFKNNQQVNIVEQDILTWNPEYRYDFIVSTLPHIALEADFVKNMVKHYKKLSVNGGKCSFVEYWGLANLNLVFIWGKARENYKSKIDALHDFIEENNADSNLVLRNVPPAIVHNLTIG